MYTYDIFASEVNTLVLLLLVSPFPHGLKQWSSKMDLHSHDERYISRIHLMEYTWHIEIIIHLLLMICSLSSWQYNKRAGLNGLWTHGQNMKNERLPKRTETKKLGGSRKRGRLELSWEDCVKRDTIKQHIKMVIGIITFWK